jgi:hypothetical protein
MTIIQASVNQYLLSLVRLQAKDSNGHGVLTSVGFGWNGHQAIFSGSFDLIGVLCRIFFYIQAKHKDPPTPGKRIE